MKNGRFSVIIIEPSEVLTTGLCSVINGSPGLRVVGSFPDLAVYQEQSPISQKCDIVIVNPALIYGRKGTAKALFPDARVVALVYNYIDRETLQQFHETIELYDKPARILHKLETVMEQAGHEPTSDTAGELSEREREILIAVARGMMNKEIADKCHISIHTVISHRKNISRKTGIKSVSGFVVYALLNNLIGEYELQ